MLAGDGQGARPTIRETCVRNAARFSMVQGAPIDAERNLVTPTMLNPPNVPAPAPASDPDVQLMLRFRAGDDGIDHLARVEITRSFR